MLIDKTKFYSTHKNMQSPLYNFKAVILRRLKLCNWLRETFVFVGQMFSARHNEGSDFFVVESGKF